MKAERRQNLRKKDGRQGKEGGGVKDFPGGDGVWGRAPAGGKGAEPPRGVASALHGGRKKAEFAEEGRGAKGRKGGI